jgi:hypothetical protein
MTGITAPCCHHPAMDHPRSAKSRGGLVTRLTGRGGRDMIRRFAHHPGISAAMTGRATRHYSRVVICGPRKRHRGLMTRLAPACGGEVIRRFTHDPGISAAMTGRTPGHDPGVIHRRSRPEGRRRFVARLTAKRRGYVRRRFAQGCPAVRAGRAAGRDPGVIECGPGK